MFNFWNNLSKPFFCLAPMADVTDFAFREMFAKYSNPHPAFGHLLPKGEGNKKGLLGEGEMNKFVMYTEFVNVDGLLHPEGFERLKIDLKFSEIQRPIVAQIWGRSPIKFQEAAELIVKLGFDGIDINFGCPQDKEIGQGTCAALIREPELALEIIKATKKGAGDLPVSVKTRIGYSENTVGNWMRVLLGAEPAAIAIHARTKQEKSKTPAHWEAIAEAVRVRDQMFPINPHPSASGGHLLPKGEGNKVGLRPLIIGNGDIKSRDEGLERIKQTGCDGVMVGRGAFGNPWFFRDDNHQPPIQDRLMIMLEHAELFDKEFSGMKGFQIMRKHFKAYASGFDGAHELRAKLMETKNLDETKKIVEEFLTNPFFK